MANTTATGLNAIIAMQGPRKSGNLIPSPRKALMGAAPSIGQGLAGVGFWEIVEPVSIGLSAYHGYKRNRDSLGWGLAWGLLGGLFPIITPVIAFAEGYAEPE
jgi:hypothetical protein